MEIGLMEMPPDFKYKSVYLKGKPKHLENDSFSRRHPAMNHVRRAKIFSPFDALKGFSDAVASKDILYISRPELTEEEKADINHKLNILHEMTRNRRIAQQSRVTVQIDYFQPCLDEDNAAYGSMGQHLTIRGICERVDIAVSHCIFVDQTSIRFDDILAIYAPEIFKELWETETP